MAYAPTGHMVHEVDPAKLQEGGALLWVECEIKSKSSWDLSGIWMTSKIQFSKTLDMC